MTAPSRSPKFRTRLIILVLLLVTPAFGLVFYGNLEQRRIEKAKVRQGATALSELAGANQATFVKNTRQLLTTLAQFPFLVLATNRPFCEVHFSNLLKLSPDYVNFGLIETDGTLFCNGAETNVSENLNDRSYFQRVIQTKRFSIGDFQVGRLTAEPELSFGYPVLDEKGGVKRVLFASLKLSLLSEAVADVRLPAHGAVTVIDRNGTVLAQHPESEKWVGKSLAGTGVAERILARREDMFEAPGLDGVPRLHAVTPIKEGDSPGLFVSVGIPLEVSFAHANQALVRNLVVLGLVAAAVLAGARFYAEQFFLRPVNALVAATHRLAEGDLSVRTGRIRGAAELAHLARAFDEMAERLQKRQTEIAQAHEQISRLNEDLERRVRERTVQLEAANQELEAFSYSVSHDLRAPLRHIDGFSDLLTKHLGGSLDDKGKRFLKTISDSAKRMGRLIDDLLVFSRMGRSEMRHAVVDLERLAQEARTELQTQAEGREVVWKNGGLPSAQADAAMLRQVFINLLSNALKYSRDRNPAIIETGVAKGGPDEVVIFVRDNGAGFDMRYADKLFGVFQRLHRAEEFEGTGIGLANVRRIILRHGGRTWAEGKVGEGATFFFSLPATAPSVMEPTRS